MGHILTLKASFLPLWLPTHLLILGPLPLPQLMMRYIPTKFISFIFTLTTLLVMLLISSCSPDGAASLSM